MKMVKSLLLGSAAGLVAVGGAQAADLPVKAKAVEYVKVCSAYGAGYFYIPGTDTCLKIGGYARFDTDINASPTFRPAIVTGSAASFNGPGAGGYAFPFIDGDDADLLTRVRGVFNMDARTQTEYGTLRSYVRFGAEWNSQTGAGSAQGSGLYFERAFIQFAGFTFGYTQSFFDLGTNYMMTTPFAGSNTWTTTLAYTAQFGNGFSASLALEDNTNRTTGVQAAGSSIPTAGAFGPVVFSPGNGGVAPFGALNPFVTSTAGAGMAYANYRGGQSIPDIVANLRLDQAWGTFMVSGALHQVNMETQLYLGAPYIGASTSDTWGWALGATAEFKLPFLGAGDSLLLQANYADGAVNYAGLSGNVQGVTTGWGRVKIDSFGILSGGFAPIADAMATNPFGGYDTVTAWSLLGEFRHFWTPGLRSVLFAGYSSLEVPETNIVGGTNATMWQVGTDLIWSPVKNLDIGLEVVYSKLDTDVPLQLTPTVTQTGGVSNSLVGGSADVVSGGLRVQRNF